MSCSNNYKPPRKSGAHCQLPEVSSNTFDHNRISGVSSRRKNFDFISSKGEDKESQKCMPINSRQPTALNTTTFPIVGLPNFHYSGSFPAPIHFRYLQIDKNKALSTCQDYSATLSLSLSQHAKEELIWWRDNLKAWNGKALVSGESDLIIETDASRKGWGASCMAQTTGGRWSLQEQHLHINCLELLAGAFALKAFTKNKAQMRV